MSDKLLTIAGVVLEPGTLWVDRENREYEFIGEAEVFKDGPYGHDKCVRSLVFMNEDGDPVTRFCNGYDFSGGRSSPFDIVGPKLSEPKKRVLYVFEVPGREDEINISVNKLGNYKRIGQITITEDMIQPLED